MARRARESDGKLFTMIPEASGSDTLTRFRTISNSRALGGRLQKALMPACLSSWNRTTMSKAPLHSRGQRSGDSAERESSWRAYSRPPCGYDANVPRFGARAADLNYLAIRQVTDSVDPPTTPFGPDVIGMAQGQR